MYRHPLTGDLYPSITNIIDVLEKPWLGRWAAKFVAGAAWDSRFALMKLEDREQAVDMLKGAPWRKTRKAGDLGGDIHAVAEAIAADEKLPPISEEAEPYVDGFLSFVAEFDPAFQILEGTVFNDTHQYAGTFDFLALIEGLLILGDYKTGGGVYDEVALQLAAGRFAEFVWDKHTGELLPMSEIDGCIAVQLQPGKHTVFTVDAGMEAFYAFLGLRGAWPWDKDHTGAVGPRMNKVRLVREFSSGAEHATQAGAAVASATLPAPVEGSPAAETEGAVGEPQPRASGLPSSDARKTGDGPEDSTGGEPADPTEQDPAEVTEGEGREQPLTAERMAVPSPAGEQAVLGG